MLREMSDLWVTAGASGVCRRTSGPGRGGRGQRQKRLIERAMRGGGGSRNWSQARDCAAGSDHRQSRGCCDPAQASAIAALFGPSRINQASVSLSIKAIEHGELEGRMTGLEFELKERGMLAKVPPSG